LISSTILSVVLSSCSTVQEVPKIEYVVMTPEKIEAPTPPTLMKLNPNKSLEDKTNFKNLQINFSLLNNYIESLRQTITYYETSIDHLNEQKNSN